MKPLIFLSHRLHVRNWVASGLLDMLSYNGIKGTVAAPTALLNEMLLPPGWGGIPTEVWWPPALQAKILEGLRLGTLVHGAREGGLNYRLKLQAKRPPVAAAELWAWRALGQITDPLPLIRAIERRLPQPDADFPDDCTHLILPTMIHEDVSQRGVIRAARRANRPYWAVPASWDTLVTKGAFLEIPDRIGVWGRHSAIHAVERHGFHRVDIVGPPQFWPYSVPSGIPAMALDRYILFAGTTVNYAPDEARIVRHLADEMAKDSLLKDRMIVYRPHPRAPHPAFSHERILLDPRWKGGWSLDRADLPYLRTLIEGAFCTVAAFSTVVIESALCGRPSIMIGFGDSAHGTGKALDHAQYEHMAAVTGKPGIALATDMKGLVDRLHVCAAGAWPSKEGRPTIKHWANDIAECLTEDPRVRILHWLKEGA